MANTKKKAVRKTKEKKEEVVKTKNTKRKNKKSEKKDLTTKILLVVFLILCVVVFVLATLMITQSNDAKNNQADLSIPITKEELNKGISVDIDMSDVGKNESKEYRIEATNYLKDEVNKEVMNYQISISSDAKVDVELYSSNENYELLNGKNILSKQRLGKDKKEEINYTLKITQRQNPTDKELVNVKFENED